MKFYELDRFKDNDKLNKNINALSDEEIKNVIKNCDICLSHIFKNTNISNLIPDLKKDDNWDTIMYSTLRCLDDIDIDVNIPSWIVYPILAPNKDNKRIIKERVEPLLSEYAKNNNSDNNSDNDTYEYLSVLIFNGMVLGKLSGNEDIRIYDIIDSVYYGHNLRKIVEPPIYHMFLIKNNLINTEDVDIDVKIPTRSLPENISSVFKKEFYDILIKEYDNTDDINIQKKVQKIKDINSTNKSYSNVIARAVAILVMVGPDKDSFMITEYIDNMVGKDVSNILYEIFSKKIYHNDKNLLSMSYIKTNQKAIRNYTKYVNMLNRHSKCDIDYTSCVTDKDECMTNKEKTKMGLYSSIGVNILFLIIIIIAFVTYMKKCKNNNTEDTKKDTP